MATDAENAGKPSLGVVSFQHVGEHMAGPSIRCLELARALAGDARVTLLAPEGSSPQVDDSGKSGAPGFDFAIYEPQRLTEMLSGYDALLLQGSTLDRQPDLGSLGGSFLIIDLYVPLIFEALVHYSHLPLEEQESTQGQILMATADRLTAGDFFLAASERQRDFWLGWLAATGRLTPAAYREDNELRALIDVVPFGLPDEPPAATGVALKGVHPAVGPDDKVLIWGGGIYNWLDPFTPIRAVALLKERRPDIKLFFLGARHPDPNVPEMKAYDEAVALARELGIEGTQVIFNDSWVPYVQRAGYLLDADLGVSANLPHIETHFSFRTRLLDCFWAGLPVVTTTGDPLSEMVAQRELGLVTPPVDAEAFAASVLRLLDDAALAGRCRENLRSVTRELQWSTVVEPVRRRLSGIEPGARQAPRHRLGDDEFWRMLSGKEDDIQRLWEMVREKEVHLNNLGEMVKEKDIHITEFQKIIAERDLHVQELSREVLRRQQESLLHHGARRFRDAVRAAQQRSRRGR